MKAQEFGRAHSQRSIILLIWYAQVQQSEFERWSICPHHVLCLLCVYFPKHHRAALCINLITLQPWLIRVQSAEASRGASQRERQKEREWDVLIVFPVTHYLLRQPSPPSSFLFFSVFSLSPPHICFLGWCSCCYLLSRTHLIPSRGKAGVLECPGTSCISALCYSHLRGFVISLPERQE